MDGARGEGLGDKLRAFALALGLHVACLLALLVGLWWTHETRPVVMPGPVIEATLVGPTAAPKAKPGASRPRPAPPKPAPPKPAPEPEPPAPPPKPEPQPEPPKPVEQVPTEVQRQDQVDRERIAALAEQKAADERREQEERVRQKQVLLEEEKQRKLKEEQRKQLAEIRKQREAAERKVKLEQQRLAQLEDRNREAQAEAAPAAEHEAREAQTGANGADNDLVARYAAAIQAAVTQNWNRPDSAQTGLRCVLQIAQIPGGEVISAKVGSPCNADAVTRNSIEQAVMKAAPLPYQGYEKVFRRNINLNFKYDG
jgi:colicin import membrane protein